MKPVIGITCSYAENGTYYHLSRDYVEAVERAGGTAVMLPCTTGIDLEIILARLDALILSGGGDIDPFFFGEEPLPETGKIDPVRDEFELEITRRAKENLTPVLAICRGLQVLNVAGGGSVCQDLKFKIKSPLKHYQQAPRSYPTHNLEVKEDTLAFQVLESRFIRVNSFHHQSIREAAPGFIVSARAPDGVEEIIEYTGEWRALGLQFHPENMWRQNLIFLEFFSWLVRQGKYRLVTNNNTS